MGTEQRTDYRIEPGADPRLAHIAELPGWLPLRLQPWLLRRRERWLAHRIDAVQRQLAGEFALTETAVLHAELDQLQRLRDHLLHRLAERR